MENKYLKWLSSESNSVYWHDSAIRSEQLDAFDNGAVGMTTNPFLINATLRNDTEFWKDKLQEIPKGLTGDEKVLLLIKCVTGYYADQLMPIFNKKNKGMGYVCAQTNPSKTGDFQYMVEQAEIYSQWAPNIVVKLPGTRAGIEACEVCAAKGISVAITVSFSVSQVLAAGEAFQRGADMAKEKGIEPGLGIAVLMVGRLDDYLRDVAHDTKSIVTEYDINHAGTACIKRAYDIFQERGYEAYIMPAGCRNADHIVDLAGANMIMSISPKITEMIIDEKPDTIKKIDNQVSADSIKRLLSMPEFRKAYEPKGLSIDELISFGATNRTTTQFIECGWKPLSEFQY